MKKKRLFLLLGTRLGRRVGSPALVLAFELAQQQVAALGRAVQGELGRDLAVPDALQLFFEDRADLLEFAEADAARFARRMVEQDLPDRDFLSRVLFVEAGPRGALVGGARHRHVA